MSERKRYYVTVSWKRTIGAEHPQKGTIKEHWFEYRDTYPPQAKARIQQLIAQEREAFHSMCLYTERKRSKKYAAELWCLWAEADKNPGIIYSRLAAGSGWKQIPYVWQVENVPDPTVIVESSPGKFHLYWYLTKAIEPTRGEQLNLRLTQALGADSSGWDATQLLRVPGTVNYKYKNLPVVRIIKDGEETFDPDDLVRLLPIPEPTVLDAKTPRVTGGSEPPVRLVTGVQWEIWNGRRAVYKEETDLEPRVDRSKTLVKIAHMLAEAGATTTAITNALAERDLTLGFQKYVDRTDAAIRYGEIAEHAVIVAEARPEESGPQLVARPFSDIEERPVEWIVYPYLPLGKLVILDGDPMVGKTYFALALASAISRGRSLSFGEGWSQQPGKVILLSDEDDPSDTLKPRLRKLGADMQEVIHLEGFRTLGKDNARESEVQRVTMSNVELLEKALQTFRPRMIILDPVQAYLGADKDMNRANVTRPILAGLKTLAEEYRATFVLIRHLRKEKGGQALYRGLGSIDFIGAARAAMQFSKDPEDSRPGSSVMSHLKYSLTARGPSVRFRVDDTGLTIVGLSPYTADELGQPEESDQRQVAREFIETLLPPGGEILAAEIESEADDAGIKRATLYNTRKAMGIITDRERKSDGTWGRSMWKRPAKGLE